MADAVKEARRKAGLSQEKLAAAIGVSSSNYNKYETGKRRFTKAMIIKLHAVESLGLNLKNLEAYELLDRYPLQTIKLALELHKKASKTPSHKPE